MIHCPLPPSPGIFKSRGRDVVRPRESVRYRPPIIMDPNARLLKSDPPDISPTEGLERGAGRDERARGAAHRLSYNLCSHLKETLPGGTGSRIARTPRVWSYITSRPVSRIVRYRFDWSRVRGIFQLRGGPLALKVEVLPLKSRVLPSGRGRKRENFRSFP